MNRIVILRKEKRMTQRELSERLHIAPITLSRYETGKREPSLSLLKKISIIFDGVSIDYISGVGDTKLNLESLVNNLNRLGRKELVEYAERLAEQDEYKK